MKTITIDDNPSILNLMRFIMNKIDPEGSHFFVSSAEEGFSLIEIEGIRIVFLDIEMPNISGIETAKFLNDKYRDIDVIFITGHTEYAMVGHKLHCSSFVTKPFDENDIAEALKWLRNPVKSEKALKVRCGGHFAVFVDDKPFRFDRRLTYELFAYLIYKNGAFATNGEIITVLWGGNVDKQALLRKHIKDMRDCFGRIGAENVLIKMKGSIGVNMAEIELEGDPAQLAGQFGWIV